MPLFYSQLVSIERTVFDVLGQMWLTMLVNGMNLICTMTGVLGTCVKEKIAMAVVNDLPFTIRKCSYQNYHVLLEGSKASTFTSDGIND